MVITGVNKSSTITFGLAQRTDPKCCPSKCLWLCHICKIKYRLIQAAVFCHTMDQPFCLLFGGEIAFSQAKSLACEDIQEDPRVQFVLWEALRKGWMLYSYCSSVVQDCLIRGSWCGGCKEGNLLQPGFISGTKAWRVRPAVTRPPRCTGGKKVAGYGRGVSVLVAQSSRSSASSVSLPLPQD